MGSFFIHTGKGLKRSPSCLLQALQVLDCWSVFHILNTLPVSMCTSLKATVRRSKLELQFNRKIKIEAENTGLN